MLNLDLDLVLAGAILMSLTFYTLMGRGLWGGRVELIGARALWPARHDSGSDRDNPADRGGHDPFHGLSAAFALITSVIRNLDRASRAKTVPRSSASHPGDVSQFVQGTPTGHPVRPARAVESVQDSVR